MDCRYLQGYLLGGPVRPAELRRRVDEFDPTVLDDATPE
jgi:EAL domain-containing protein (putative c-di-GMP-specific phosphodiesterase class I)